MAHASFLKHLSSYDKAIMEAACLAAFTGQLWTVERGQMSVDIFVGLKWRHAICISPCARLFLRLLAVPACRHSYVG